MKKIRSLIFVLLLFVLSATPALAAEEKELGLGFWIEAQVASKGAERFIGSYERELVGPFGISVTAVQESDGYREFYAGPTVKLVDWLQVGIGIGREHIPEVDEEESLDSTRYNTFFSIEYEKIALYGSFENGDGGPWHELRAVYNPIEKFGIGIMDEARRGLGPRFEYNIRENVQVWGAILYDRDVAETTTVLAVNFSF